MTKRFILLFGLTICAGAVSAEPLIEGNADAGKQKAAACAACHGPKGNMQSEQFPKLAGQGSPYIYEQLKLFKSGKRKNAIMAGQAAGLSDQDMKNLAAYYASQQTRPGAADVSIAPAGAAIYHGGKPKDNVPACSGCHGPSGLGNAAAKYPRLSGQNPQYIVTQLTAYRDGTRSGYRNAAIMNGVAERLSDEDIQALASYVAGLAPAKKNAATDQGALMQHASAPKSGAQSDSDDKSAASDEGASDQDDTDESGRGSDANSQAESEQAQDKSQASENTGVDSAGAGNESDGDGGSNASEAAGN